ncbi:MAG: CPXCG motif-containing cysteine-rich protein [Chromatiales bacterium]|nr:CPXCG motif-containing cysteine-rich protein [Chromatiales bacterium]
MIEREEHELHCPYCGEPFTALVDPSDTGRYVEDCPVCCRPIEFEAVFDPGMGVYLRLKRDDD